MRKVFATLLLAALAIMACGNKTTNPPTVITPIRISTPSNGATLHDRQLIHAVAGEGYSFTRVDFLIDGDSVVSDAVPPYDYQWNIFTYASGSHHTLQARGNTADSTFLSAVVNVEVAFSSGFSYVSTYSSSSQQINGVQNYGNVLFVSSGTNGVEALDISNLSSPIFRSRLTTSGFVLHTDVEYPYIYMADRDQRVLQADFSDIDSLMPLFAYSSQSQISDLAVSDNFLFVVEYDALSILRQFNLTPYTDSRMQLNDHLNYIVARHDTAFVVGNLSFFIIDCHTPSSSHIVGTYNNLDQAQGVAVADTFAFIANSGGGVLALSIADPGNPRFLARFNSGQMIVTVDVGDGVLFAGATTGQIYALDYHTAGSIGLLYEFDASNQVREIDYRDNYVYVAASSNVDILRFIR